MMISNLLTVPSATPRRAGEDPPTFRKDTSDTFLPLNDEIGAPIPFEILLDAKRLLAAATRGAGGDKTSPTQVFEPNVADAHQHRLTTLKEQYRPGGARSSGDRLERTSIETRMSSQAGRGDPEMRTVSERTGPSGTRPDSSRPVSGIDAGRPTGGGVALPIDGTLQHTGGSVLPPVDSRLVPRGASPSGAGTQAESSAQLSAPAISGQAAVPTITPSGEAGGSRTQTPAQQVAQLLGVGRGAEGESARSPTLPSAVADGRSAPGDAKATGGSPTGGRAAQRTSSPSSTGAEGKVGESARSTFDQLVQSIRFQLGARRSSARLYLQPPELGRLRVQVHVDGEQVSVDVRAETAEARGLLAERAAQLIAALEKHGIHVQRFDVTTDFADGHPDDWRDAGTAGSDGVADRERDLHGEEAASPAGVWPSEETGAAATEGDVPDVEVVAETRLDVRV